MRKLIVGITVLMLHLGCAQREVASSRPVLSNVPKSDGTFIQSYLVRNWTDERWQQEFTALKEAGMQYLILGSTLNTDKNGKMYAIFPSQLPGVVNRYGNDIVEDCLRNAKAAGFKVFLGLNFDEKWWSTSIASPWIIEQMKVGNQLAKELIDRYKSRYGTTMYGWYWVWEMDNIKATTPLAHAQFAAAMNVNLDYLNSVSPDMPFMLCPFFNYRLGSSRETVAMWKNVFSEANFKKGDIFAPQDCIGAGGLEMHVLDEWFAGLKTAVDTKPGLEFWVDTETFDQRFWTSATLDRFVKQMEVVAPYVSNYVTFAYSHYYSPWHDNPQFHKDYLHYLRKGSLPDTEVVGGVEHAMVNLQNDRSYELSWSVKSSSEKNVAGYFIYLNDSLFADCQYKPGKNISTNIRILAQYLKTNNEILIQPYSASGKFGVGIRQRF
jgi:hypothetical protein